MNSRFTYELNKNATFDDLLRNSFVLSISDVQCQFFYDNMSKLNLKNMPIRMQGFNKQEFGNIELNQLAMLSHVQTIHLAKALNLPFVVIFEDDSIFDLKNYTISQIDEVVRHIPCKCNILSFGWFKKEDKEIHVVNNLDFDKNIFDTERKHLWGCNAYIIFEHAYDLLLQHLDVWAIDISFDFIENMLITKENFFPQKRIDFTDSITYVSI